MFLRGLRALRGTEDNWGAVCGEILGVFMKTGALMCLFGVSGSAVERCG